MKVCLSSRQSQEYLKKADEIKVQYRDRESIPDLIMDYPEATIILENAAEEVLDWEVLHRWNILAQGKFVLCLASPEQLEEALARNIKAYLGWSVNDYETLNSLKNLNVEYARLGGPLFFNLIHMSTFGLKVRAVPNVAFNDGLTRKNGVAGTWIRPEDLDAYEGLIDVIEFENCDLQTERALYRIYFETKSWLGDLGSIIQGLNYPGENRLINPDLVKKRLVCKQRCQSGGNCQACYRTLTLANSDLFKQYTAEK